MKTIRYYYRYFRANPAKYWFRRKRYGWGWVPVRWQGWLVTMLATFAMVGIGLYIDSNPTKGNLFFSSLSLGLVVLALLIIAFITGESPKWQWGTRRNKKR